MPVTEKKRTDGQLWIDRKIPHGLKYHVDGETYQVQTTKIYKASDTLASISAGTVVAIESVSNDSSTGEDVLRIKPACFPKEADVVLGVCGKTATAGEDLVILTSGLITLNEDDISRVFYTGDALSESAYKADGYYKGAPVYWFIGRSFKQGDTFKYDDPYDNKGKITLCTPSGIKWKLGPLGTEDLSDEDQSFNVYYSNLPVIGTLVDYKLDDSTNPTKFTELKISLNVSSYESNIVWTWPFRGYYQLRSYASDNDGYIRINIRHGLFPKVVTSSSDSSDMFNYRSFRPRCFCDIVALGINDDTEQQVFAGIDNFYGLEERESSSEDKRTELEFHNVQKNKRLSVTGKVIYHFHYRNQN